MLKMLLFVVGVLLVVKQPWRYYLKDVKDVIVGCRGLVGCRAAMEVLP